MSQERKESFKKTIRPLIIWSIITGIIGIGIILMWINDIDPTVSADNWVRVIYWMFFVTITMLSPISFMIPITILADKISKYRSYEECLIKTQKLSSEFSEVTVVVSDYEKLKKVIPLSEIKCMAKFDENNIVYKIQVDIEASTDDYKKFFETFGI